MPAAQLFASCTAPDKAVQPPGGDAFMPLLKVLSADTACSCPWKGRQIWPDILSQILLCAGESGCWWWGCSSGWRQPPPRGCFPANIIAKQADAFNPGALHLLLLGGARGRTGKWRWRSTAKKNERDQARSGHMAAELLAL